MDLTKILEILKHYGPFLLAVPFLLIGIGYVVLLLLF